MAVFCCLKEVKIMQDRAELVNNYRDRLVRNLGIWEEDPRLVAAVDARAARVTETMTHMDRPTPKEVRSAEMKPGVAYKL